MSIATNRIIPRSMAPKRKWAEDMQARFPKGTFARIAAVLWAESAARRRMRLAAQNRAFCALRVRGYEVDDLHGGAAAD